MNKGEDRGILAGVSQDKVAWKPWNVISSTSNNGSFLTRRQIKVYHPSTDTNLVDCISSKIVIVSDKSSSEYIYEVEITGFPTSKPQLLRPTDEITKLC